MNITEMSVKDIVESMYKLGELSQLALDGATEIDYNPNNGDIEQQAISRLTNLVTHSGGTVDSYYDGTMDVYVKAKLGMLDLVNALEQEEIVDSYDVSIVATDKISGITDLEDISDVDLSMINDTPFITYHVVIVLNPDIVMFEPQYVDIENFYDEGDSDNGDNFEYVSESKKSEILIKTKYNNELKEIFGIVKENKNLDETIYLAFDSIDESISDYIREGDVILATDKVISELTRKIKVNFRGVKRIKMQCARGYKYDTERKTCTKISGADLANMRKSHLQMARTKKSMGSSYKIKITRKTKKAERYRKLMGLNT